VLFAKKIVDRILTTSNPIGLNNERVKSDKLEAIALLQKQQV
jgi:hypothetical protein